MEKANENTAIDCQVQYPALRTLGVRAGFLFANFFLIIMALYQLKPASRSLFIASLSSVQLPYVWIADALTMGVFTIFYHRLVARRSRFHVVLGTTLVLSALLVLFRFLFFYSTKIVAILFYVYVDLLGVVLVEQFWSLTNSIYTTREGKRWYGFVGTGGLVGGVMGGGFAEFMIKHTPLTTPDLALSAAAIISLISLLTWIMVRYGLYCEADQMVQREPGTGNWQFIRHSRYLLLIAGVLLLAQIVSPIVEYQFLNTVEASYPETEARTAFLAHFFSLMGLVSIAINLGITPLIHRQFGPIVGILVQPLMISVFSWCYLLQSSLFLAGALKVSDRGLSYSINRASKELLYVPVDSLGIYQAKAWIDMLGYRLFKILGSVLILLFTRWLPITVGLSQLSWITMTICGFWVLLTLLLQYEYRTVCAEAV